MTYNKMSSNIYQFSCNLGNYLPKEQQDQPHSAVLRDIFPYLKLRSITSVIQILSLLPFLLQLTHATVLPKQSASSPNLINAICSYLFRSLAFIRFGSEYQYRLGVKYFTILMMVALFVELFGLLSFGLGIESILLGSSGLLSIFVLSALDLNKFKQSELIEFQQEEKVQNYDLLDLNDTIVKMRSKEHTFTYESYTNREFYTHHLPKQKQVHKKTSRSNLQKRSTISDLIDQPLTTSETNISQMKAYKLILFNFIVYAHEDFYGFLTFAMAEVVIYFLFSTRLIKKPFQ